MHACSHAVLGHETSYRYVGVAASKRIALKSMATDIWNQRLDAGNDEVPRHAGQIADGMHEWEGPLSERLGLTDTDVAEIKTEHPEKLKLQS